MYYLVWWNPFSWLSDGLEKVAGAIVHAVRTLFYMLDTLLYQLVINLYNAFELLCTSRLLDSQIMNEIAVRVGLLLGIIMVFMVTFSFIKMLLDPDTITDKKNGAVGIIKKSLIVIVMLGSSQFIFDTLYKVQRIIIKENIISKIILPYDVDTENFGALLSEEVFTSFYRINSSLEENEDEAVKECQSTVNRLKYSIYTYGNFEPGYNCLNESIAISDEETGLSAQEVTIIDYNWLIATAVGVALVYFLFSYCISVGVRTIQLSVLEIIAPMAIISYISPKDDNMFKKWSKIYISTYIDVFIRIGIINFAAFLIATILDGGDKWFFWQSVGNPTDLYTKGFLMVAMILALLTFAKKAPKLIEELFPSGSSKLGLGGWSMKDMFGVGAIGAVTGATATGAIGFGLSGISRYRDNRALGKGRMTSLGAGVFGSLTGLGRGFVSGAKKGNVFKNIASGVTAQRKADNDYTALITSGGSTLGKIQSRATDLISETKGQRYNRQIRDLDKMDEFKKSMYAAADEMIDVKSAKDAWEQMHQWQGESLAAYQARKQAAYDRYRDLRNSAADAAISGHTSYTDASGTIHTMTGDDFMYATDIRSVISQANAYSNSHSVQYWDDATGTYQMLGPISSRADLADASTYAHQTKTHITSSADYSAAIANDRAAGVNERRKPNKD